MSAKKTNNLFAIAGGGILLLFFLTRYLALQSAGSFWFDESFSVYFSSFSLTEMWQYLRFEHNPLSHFIALHFWMSVFGATELSARMLSTFAGAGSLGLLYLLGKELYSKQVGLWAMFFMTISSFFLYHQTEARMYSLLILFALSTMFSYWKLFKKTKDKTTWLIVFTLSCLFLVHTHITAWVLPVALVLHAMIFSKKKSFIPILVSLSIVTFTFILWLLPVMQNKFLAGHVSQGWFFFQSGGGYLFSHLSNFFLIGETSIILKSLASLIVVTLFLHGIMQSERPSLFAKLRSKLQTSYWPISFHLAWTEANTFLLLILFITFLFGFGLQIVVTKYVLIAGLALMLIMANGLAQIDSVKTKTMLALFLLVSTLPMQLQLSFIQRHHWNEVAMKVDKLTNDDSLVLAHSFVSELPLRFYTKTDITPFYPLEDELSQNERIVRYNWQGITNHDSLEKMNEFTSDYDRVILVSSTPNNEEQDPVKRWFWSNGWSLEQTYRWNGYGDPEVLVLVR